MSNMNMGNMGMGNMGIGNAGAAAAPGNATFFADRVSLPFVTKRVKYPPESTRLRDADQEQNWRDAGQERNWSAEFSCQHWGAEWQSWLALTEFASLRDEEWPCDDKSSHVGWKGIDILPPWAQQLDGQSNFNWYAEPVREEVRREINNLVMAARDERADALGEILTQDQEFVSYFLNLLSIRSSHPATARLMVMTSFIAGYCAMYYKGKYRRPRPSMVCPALLPPVPVPGHASFPSAHSTQAHAIASCITALFDFNKDVQYALGANLRVLAGRIARNREIAGLHYESDSVAGENLAARVWECLAKALGDTVRERELGNRLSWFRCAFNEAKREWQQQGTWT